MKTVTVFIFVIISLLVKAENSIRPFGHNLSHNDYILTDHKCVVGYVIAGCRIKDSFIGTSIFLIREYSINNMYIRSNIIKFDKSIHSFELAYFKSSSNAKVYDMESSLLNYIYSYKFSDSFSNHVNFGLNYYRNDKRPFSLRRPNLDNKRFQLNISTFMEAKLTQNFFLNGELGILHMFQDYPRLHAGASVGYIVKSFYMQLGFSLSSTTEGLFVNSGSPSRYDYQQSLLDREYGFDSEIYEEDVKEDFSLHPELNIQYYF